MALTNEGKAMTFGHQIFAFKQYFSLRNHPGKTSYSEMASSFGLNSFYGGSKGRCDSSSTDSDLNCVKTRRKAGRPPVSQNKEKKRPY